ncbi:hypothetical protein H6P81_017030 [Aristolochia fimbriata]|uniref:Pentatricopeptide repeat-containing protein n=1 Tax=Aristolochia fimbriata TaxID=158543 RepID=A0AAV7DZZ7_ARIFI|nr:hypothetical protein H6P81_017030 [Aristolochia fimbriata]
MNRVSRSWTRLKVGNFRIIWRSVSDFGGDDVRHEHGCVRNDDCSNGRRQRLNPDLFHRESSETDANVLRGPIEGGDTRGETVESDSVDDPSARWRYSEGLNSDLDKVFFILQQDGPGSDARSVLSEMEIKVSNTLFRGVLLRLLNSINPTNKSRCAKLGFKFFAWSGSQVHYRHTTNSYNLILKLFAECEQFQPMWRLVEEMIENGVPTTARTFHIVICSCGEVGVARKLVERFIESKTFNYRPFKHSFNAILHTLLTIKQYRLIEWVYQKMLLHGHSPDVLTYNVLMCTKHRLGKFDEFNTLLHEMFENGLSPDLHTYNIFLHILGKDGKSLAAQNLLNHMEEVGAPPSSLHFTALIDGLSRAGKLVDCKYFFDEMIKKGCEPDVVCYTVMITSYAMAGELEEAQALFEDMFVQGKLPNVFTYNSMIRGLCIAGKFKEALFMLKDMESRGCNPNFCVYSTLVTNLLNAKRWSEAKDVIGEMMEKGHYVHLISKLKGYRRL